MGLLNVFPVNQLQLDDGYIRGKDGLIYFGIVASIPADGGAGYGYGCILINSATAGVYINTDTDATCDFDAQAATALTNGAVSLEHLDAAITPSHVIKYAGTGTWSGGGASLAFSVPGVVATDRVSVTCRNNGTENAVIWQAAADTDHIDILLSTAATSNDLTFDYIVVRAAA